MQEFVLTRVGWGIDVMYNHNVSAGYYSHGRFFAVKASSPAGLYLSQEISHSPLLAVATMAAPFDIVHIAQLIFEEDQRRRYLFY